MRKSRLTLNVDPKVIARAKRYAKRSGVSLSAMVEVYLSKVVSPPPVEDLPPILRSLQGILKKAPRQRLRISGAKRGSGRDVSWQHDKYFGADS